LYSNVKVHLKQVSPFREYDHVLWKNSVSDHHRADYNTLLPLRTRQRIWTIQFFRTLL